MLKLFNYTRNLQLISLVYILFTILISTTIYSADNTTHWSYEGKTGPTNWSELSKGYINCKIGLSQSPINIKETTTVDLKPIEFHYNPSPLKIINNGHTIQVNYTAESHIISGGKRFNLLQFHFHTPSEHQINGNHHEMEVHFVHRSEDGQYAVVGVLMKKGTEHPLIQTLWNNLPKDINKVQSINTQIDPGKLIPSNQSYYLYSGSLTTPPCSEGLKWHVLMNPIEVSETQIKTFIALFKNNARPVQPMNNRKVIAVNVTGSHIISGKSHQSLSHKKSTPNQHGNIQQISNTPANQTTTQKTSSNHTKEQIMIQSNQSLFSILTLVIIIIIMLGLLFALYIIIKKKYMNNMKLKNRILTISISLIVLLIISSAYGIIKMAQIGDEIESIAKHDLPITNIINKITEHQLEQSIFYERAYRYAEMIKAGENKSFELKLTENNFHNLAKKVDGEIKQAENIATKGLQQANSLEEKNEFLRIKQQIKVINKEHDDFEKLVLQAFQLFNTNDLKQAELLGKSIRKDQDELNVKLKEFLQEVENFTLTSVKKAEQDEKSAIIILIIIVAFALTFGIILSIYISRDIVISIKDSVDIISTSSEQVASGSQQVASASQTLAEGASEMASSLEETTASLEEISAMVQNNSQNTLQANSFVEDSSKIVNQAGSHMASLKTAINEITKSSEETGKIIKIIEDIAFQTNLLALNAAVEAARAGEAGMGFAVVADEVRSLAKRTADAAKSTTELIDSSIKRIKEGFELTQTTERSFNEVVENISKLKDLIAEVSTSSQEQAQGIEQLNHTMLDMDKVVQANASSSEESSSAAQESAGAAEEMSGLAVSLLEIVQQLNSLIEGQKSSNGSKDLSKITHIKQISHDHKTASHGLTTVAHPHIDFHKMKSKRVIKKSDLPIEEEPNSKDFKDF